MFCSDLHCDMLVKKMHSSEKFSTLCTACPNDSMHWLLAIIYQEITAVLCYSVVQSLTKREVSLLFG